MCIDLGSLSGGKVLVLAGPERGLAARDRFDMDALDQSSERIEIVAPSDLEAISPSFVQGFLGKSFNLLGEQGLRQKYDFKLDDLLIEDMLDGIKRLKMQREIAGH